MKKINYTKMNLSINYSYRLFTFKKNNKESNSCLSETPHFTWSYIFVIISIIWYTKNNQNINHKIVKNVKRNNYTN